MEWLNYHHLLYFWVSAREGSILAASKTLRLKHPTISTQIKQLEASLGEKLFERDGRNLRLTEVGQMVYSYADEIFSLGNELMQSVRGRPTGRPLRLQVGIADVLPKLVAHELLQPALQLDERVKLTCREGRQDELLAALASHQLDVVLADSPVAPGSNFKAFNHLLGTCGVTVFAATNQAKVLKRQFPHSLDTAPMLAPTANTALRRSLEHWFDAHDIRPEIVAEFEDTALLKVFGQSGAGFFVAPSVMAESVCKQYDVKIIGEISDIQERFYAISADRKIKHPAVVAICDAAKESFLNADVA